VGGKCDPDRHGPPIDDTFLVGHTSDGRFSESEVRHGGYSTFDQGLTAVLEAPKVTIIATSRRVAPMSLQQILSQCVDPLDFAAIVIKGVHAPVAAYAPVCSQLIRVNTRGSTSADLSQFTYHNRRVPMEPFERIKDWTA
jgi:microcystin degradation protein MlrC